MTEKRCIGSAKFPTTIIDEERLKNPKSEVRAGDLFIVTVTISPTVAGIPEGYKLLKGVVFSFLVPEAFTIDPACIGGFLGFVEWFSRLHSSLRDEFPVATAPVVIVETDHKSVNLFGASYGLALTIAALGFDLSSQPIVFTGVVQALGQQVDTLKELLALPILPIDSLEVKAKACKLRGQTLFCSSKQKEFLKRRLNVVAVPTVGALVQVLSELGFIDPARNGAT
jgi:hypothetical protein